MSCPRLGKIRVSMRLLGRMLHLPDGCHVEAVSQHFCDLRRGSFEVYLRGEGMPECADRDDVPLMVAKVRKEGEQISVSFEEAR